MLLQTNKIFFNYLQEIVGNLVKKSIILNESSLVIKTTYLQVINVLVLLKNHNLLKYQQLIDIIAKHIPMLTPTPHTFSINFLLHSIYWKTKAILNVTANNLSYIFSATVLYKSAGWLEREVWESFGIWFKNNKDLRRLLTDYGFKGYPLKKDFPLTGFNQIFYNAVQKRFIYTLTYLAQNYRKFDLKSTWYKNGI